MKITRTQLNQIIKEEKDKLLKEHATKGFTLNVYELEDIISELWKLEGGSGLADRLTGWWELLQNDPAFMDLGKDPSDKFSGRR